jgi:hypothetical protein
MLKLRADARNFPMDVSKVCIVIRIGDGWCFTRSAEGPLRKFEEAPSSASVMVGVSPEVQRGP